MSEEPQPGGPDRAALPVPDGSMGRVVRIATPLIISSSSHATRLFCDRLMLADYDHRAFSAAFAGGVTAFTLFAIFWFTTNYSSTFVAQYIGARRPDRVGPATWQGIFMACAGGAILAACSMLGRPLFTLFGSTGTVLNLQVDYFSILCLGSAFPLLLQGLGSFWTGRGRTWTIAGIEWITVVVNLACNWVLIYGRYGFPELGIRGAAIGTILSAGTGVAIALVIFLLPANRRRFNTWPRRLFDGRLFLRLFRFGLPNGLQVSLDVGAFNLFILTTQSLSATVAAGCTIAFSINAIAFIPMLGLGVAVSILVGQCVGARRVDQAERTVRNGLILILGYMGVMTLLFLLGTDCIPVLFDLEGCADKEEGWRLGAWFLHYIAAFLLFDGIFILYKSAINGAGDTFFSMWVGVIMSWVCFALPILIVHLLDGGIGVRWAIMVGYIVVTSAVFFLRYRRGKWRGMRVIEG